MLGLCHWYLRSDLQHQAFAGLALLFLNMKKKCLVQRCNFDQPQSSCWVCFPLSRRFLLHSSVILRAKAASSLLDLVMLGKAGACRLSIIHRISSQKLETAEDISFPLLKLHLQLSESPAVIHHSALWGRRRGRGARLAEYKTTWQEQLLKQSKQVFAFSRHPALCKLLTSFSALC